MGQELGLEKMRVRQGEKVVDCAQQSLLEGECGSDPRGPGGAE